MDDCFDESRTVSAALGFGCRSKARNLDHVFHPLAQGALHEPYDRIASFCGPLPYADGKQLKFSVSVNMTMGEGTDLRSLFGRYHFRQP